MAQSMLAHVLCGQLQHTSNTVYTCKLNSHQQITVTCIITLKPPPGKSHYTKPEEIPSNLEYKQTSCKYHPQIRKTATYTSIHISVQTFLISVNTEQCTKI